MKSICITYHMTKPNETAETCITLPMEDHVADDLLRHGADSWYIERGSCVAPHPGSVAVILMGLAHIQGYEYTEAVTFEEVEQC